MTGDNPGRESQDKLGQVGYTHDTARMAVLQRGLQGRESGYVGAKYQDPVEAL